MTKTGLSVLTLLIMILIVIGLGVYKFNFTNDDVYNQSGTQINIHDGSYKVAGAIVTLKNGISEVEAAPGSASKIVTKYFGNDVSADFDGDGIQDVAFIITQNTGGSGTFYYVVALLNKAASKVGTDAVLLGDRIAPQNLTMNASSTLIVNYADRKPEESFAVAPSVGKTLYLKLDKNTNQFGEVVQNFEGEADISKMNLNMKTWNWVKTVDNNDKVVTPKTTKFTITFKTDKTFSVTTDCNGVGGEYVVKGSKITLDKMISTMMYCDGSQEQDFVKSLNEVDSFMFTSKGELVLGLKMDSGSVVFK